MNRLLPVSVVVAASCAGPGHGADKATQPVGHGATEPVTPSCEFATFVGYGGGKAEIFDIGANCVAYLIATIETKGRVFDVAWPRTDQPIALAVAVDEVTDVVDQPLSETATRAPLRRVAPPGTGRTEPEGYVFGLVTDGMDPFVERCTAWDDGGGEESEEWDCKQHVYFRLDDRRGAKAKAVKPAPREVYTPAFSGGTVAGTHVALHRGRDGVTCTADGHDTKVEPWGNADGDPFTPMSIVPLSATDYLLGFDYNGGRMRPMKGIRYRRMHGCEEDSAFLGEVVAGPGRYWAESMQKEGGWRIHVGDSGHDVLDAKGQPALFDVEGVTWTQEQP